MEETFFAAAETSDTTDDRVASRRPGGLHLEPHRLGTCWLKVCVRACGDGANRKSIFLLASLHTWQECVTSADDPKKERRLRRCEGASMELESAFEMDDESMIEMLYEENESKLRVTKCVLEACVAGALPRLAANATLMGALSRVFAEEYKRSIKLTYDLVRIFLAFANYSGFHATLIEQRVGSKCCDVVAYEVRRLQHHRDEAAKLEQVLSDARTKRRQARDDDDDGNDGDDGGDGSVEELERKRTDEARRSRGVERRLEKTLNVCFHVLLRLAEDESVEQKIAAGTSLADHAAFSASCSLSLPVLCSSMSVLTRLCRFDKSKAKIVAKFPVARGLSFLDALLPNGDERNEAGRRRRRPKSSSCIGDNGGGGYESDDGTVGVVALRLLFNLSFDEQVREHMVANAFIPKLCAVFPNNESSDSSASSSEAKKKKTEIMLQAGTTTRRANDQLIRSLSLRLLYQLSTDDRARSLFAGAVPRVMDLVLQGNSADLERTAACLAVNLALRRRNAQLMFQFVPKLVRRVLETKDVALAKVLRSLSLSSSSMQQRSLQPPYKTPWSRFVTPFVDLVTSEFATATTDDLSLEVLGVLGNLTDRDLPGSQSWAQYANDANLLDYLSRLLASEAVEHDVALEALVFAGTLATDEHVARAMASAKFLGVLDHVWRTRGDDSEIALQSAFTLFQLLTSHPQSAEPLATQTGLFQRLLDALDHTNGQVVRYADASLELILDFERTEQSDYSSGFPQLGELGSQIRRHRFRLDNRQNPICKKLLL